MKPIKAWAFVNARGEPVQPKPAEGYEPFEVYPFKWQAVGACFKEERIVRVEIREVKE